jgi:hypothetical protein
MANIRTYTGDYSQVQDSLIVAAMGATAAQAFRGRCGFMVDSYQLNNPQQPQFNSEVDEGTTTVDEATIKLYSCIAVDSALLDMSALSGMTFRGLVIESQSEIRQKIEEMQTAYNFDVVEVDGKIKAVVRGDEIAAVIPQNDLRAYAYGEQPPEARVRITRVEEKSLPRTLYVRYIDPAPGWDYKTNTQEAHRFTGNTETPVTVNLGIALTADEAKQIAERLLAILHTERRQFEWQTSFRWLSLYPTNVVQLIDGDVTHTVRITSMQAALPGLIKFTGVAHDSSVYTQDASGHSGDGFEVPPLGIPANSLMALIDAGPFRDQDFDLAGYYAAACSRGNGRWNGAFLYKEQVPGSDDYSLVTSFDAQATMGVAATTLADYTGDLSALDTTHTVDVNLYYGTLASVASPSDLDGAPINAMVIGSELIQFQTATPLTPSAPYAAKYRLSNLYRGRQNTAWATGAHSTGEVCCILDSAVQFVRQGVDEIGLTRNWKMASAAQSLANVIANSRQFQGYSIRGPQPDAGEFVCDFDDENGAALFRCGRNQAKGASQQEFYEFQASVPGGGTFSATRGATVQPNELEQSLSFELDPAGDPGAMTLVDPAGVQLIGSSGTPGMARSKQTLGVFETLLFQFEVPDNWHIPTAVILYPEDEDPLTSSYALAWTRDARGVGDVYPDADVGSGTNPNAPVQISADGEVVHGILPGDRFYVLYQDGVWKFGVNYFGRASVALHVSPRATKANTRYRVVIIDDEPLSPHATGGIRNAQIIRLDPEWLYTASAQKADNSGSLPSTIKARVRQSSFIARGPSSDWVTKTFNRP